MTVSQDMELWNLSWGAVIDAKRRVGYGNTMVSFPGTSRLKKLLIGKRVRRSYDISMKRFSRALSSSAQVLT